MTCGIPQGSTLVPLLFLLYIDDLPHCSETLTFRMFAEDTNLFASARDLKSLETLINSELGKVQVWCDVNKLSINFIKTYYMIIKSNRKASSSIEVKLQNIDGSSYLLERKDHIKYLGVMIDESLSWKYPISYTCSRILSHIGVISKLRQLKQLYYNLIYPYLSYAIIAWGSGYKTHLKRLQSKKNTVLKLMFSQLRLDLTQKVLSLS